MTAQERVVHQVGVQRSLELISQVAGRDPPEDLPVGVGEARVTGSTAAAAFLEEFLTDAHLAIVPGARADGTSASSVLAFVVEGGEEGVGVALPRIQRIGRGTGPTGVLGVLCGGVAAAVDSLH